MSAYESVRELSDDEAALMAPFERSAALLGGARWVRWGFVDNVTFSDPEAAVNGLRRAIDRLGRLAGSL